MQWRMAETYAPLMFRKYSAIAVFHFFRHSPFKGRADVAVVVRGLRRDLNRGR